jgi:hypothetical protein
VAPSPDDRRVAVVFPDTIRIADAETLAPLATISSGAGAIAWSPDGRYLAATPDLHYRDANRPAYVPGQEVTVWNASSGTLAARFPTPVYPKAIAFDEQGATLVGWGMPALAEDSASVTHFVVNGEAAGFAIDLKTSTVSAADIPPFVAATRELIATDSTIRRLSSGTVLSAIPAPGIGYGAFSADFSVLLAADSAETSPLRQVRLMNVTTGGVIAVVPTTVGPYPTPTLAVSRGGRFVAAPGGCYCAR